MIRAEGIVPQKFVETYRKSEVVFRKNNPGRERRDCFSLEIRCLQVAPCQISPPRVT